MLDIRFLAYYLDFGGKVVSKALLSQLFPSLSELLCGGQSFTEELFYSLLLLCSHSLHATAFSSLYNSFAPYLAELQSHFLTLLPFFFDQSWKVEFFVFSPLDCLSYLASPLFSTSACSPISFPLCSSRFVTSFPYHFSLSPFAAIAIFSFPSPRKHSAVLSYCIFVSL